jgi:hypothetical protein
LVRSRLASGHGHIVLPVSTIYLRHGDQFLAMHERPYDAESLLQALLAEHPEVLAGGEPNGDSHGWVLVKREAGVADMENGSGRWSLDHLFLDSEGVPTFVEVKRSSDTRARREVVAQMLDYAANGTAFWNVEQLQAWFGAECDRRGADPAEVLSSTCAVVDADGYWERVRTNLAASRIRLVFVADEIAPELRSIVEFLNRQMIDTEVLAIEVRQYVDADGERQTVVPRVVGQTEAARAAKAVGARTTRAWNKDLLVGEIARRSGDLAAGVASSLIEWAEARDGVRVDYGKGTRSGSAGIRLDREGSLLHAFNVWSYGSVEIPFDYMRDMGQAPFDRDRELRDELRRRINAAAPEAGIPGEEERMRPSFSLDALGAETTRGGFFAAIEWAFDQAVAAQPSEPADAPQQR